MNDQVNKCSSDENSLTAWGEKCGDVWSSQKIVKFILNSLDLNNPYSIKDDLIQISLDPRIQAEGKAGQSTEMGVVFLSFNKFMSDPGSEWVIGTCVKSPCVAAGNNELTSVYR